MRNGLFKKHTLINFLKFIYLFWERQWGEKIPSKLHTVSAEPDSGLEIVNREIMIWAKIKSQMLHQLSHPEKWVFFFKINFERECKRGGAEREGTEDPKGAPCWQQWAQCGARTHKPWDRDLSRSWTLNLLSHPGAPKWAFWFTENK